MKTTVPKMKTGLPARALTALNDEALRFHRDLSRKWEQVFKEHLREFPVFTESDEEAAIGGEGNTDLENAISVLFAWLESLQNLAEEFSLPCLVEDWYQQFQDESSGIPSRIKATIPQKSWETSNRDSMRVRLWKRFGKQRMQWQAQVLKYGNRMRKARGRELRRASKPARSIAAGDFFSFFYEIPVAELLLREWQRALQDIAIHLHTIHEQAEAIFQQYLPGQAGDVDGKTDLLKALQEMRPVKLFDASGPTGKTSFEEEVKALSLDIDMKWQYAGTYALPNGRFRTSEIKAQKEKLRETFDESLLAWSKHLNGELDDWKQNLEIASLLCEAGRICAETLRSLSEKTKDQILPSFETPIANVADSVEKFNKLQIDEVAELKDEILSENRLMLRKLRREQLPQTSEVLIQAQITKSLDNYLSRFRHAVSALDDRQTIFREADLEHIPPRSKLVEIEFKELVSEEILSSLESNHDALVVEVDDKLAKIMRDLSETDQIVEFNLETALDLLQNQEDAEGISKAHTVVIEGLERAGNRLKGLSDECLTIFSVCEEKLKAETAEFNRALLALADNEKIIALQFRIAKAKTQQELRDYRQNLIGKVKSALPELLSIVARLLQESKRSYLRFRKITGLMSVEPDVEQKLTQFLNETKKQFLSLPHVYQRLFRFQPLKDPRFFTGRDVELETLADKFEMWKNGDYSVTALVGEKGSGRTTLLHFAESKIYANLPVFKVDLVKTTYRTGELFQVLRQALKSECNTLDELEQKILAQESRFVCIFENLHNLFLRSVDGFDAIERFLLFVSNTHRKIFWLITCGLYSWNYLDKVVSLSRHFQDVVFLRELTVEEISSVVLKRHRVSGYTVWFEAPPNVAESRKFLKLATPERQQDYLRELFFEQLSKLSLGNITVAILFWLKAIRAIDGDKMLIQPSIEFDPSFLRLLPAEDLFTFASFLQHETLTAGEHARVFNQSVEKSALLLGRMENKGVLVETEHGYQINFLLYRPIVRTLKLNNIIH